MATTKFTLLAVLASVMLLCILPSLVWSHKPEDVLEGIVDLTPDNVESILDTSKHTLVEFYAPWCGHCKTLAPEMHKLGEVLHKRKPAEVVVAKVNCDQHADICSRYQVRGYPTIKFFPQGVKEPEDYNKGRTAEDILSFLNAKAGTRLHLDKPLSHVVDLSPDNFDSVAMNADKDVLVEFYAPWCGHCKQLAPIYEKVANAFRLDSEKVVVAKVDADAHRSIGTRFGVSGFPTLKFFPKGSSDKKPEDYNRGRTMEDFLSFLNEKAGLKRVESGLLDDAAGRTESLDALAKKFVENVDQREETIKSAETEEESRYYVKVMKNVLAKGQDYVAKEKARLLRLINGNAVNDNMLDSLKTRINVLTTFE